MIFNTEHRTNTSHICPRGARPNTARGRKTNEKLTVACGPRAERAKGSAKNGIRPSFPAPSWGRREARTIPGPLFCNGLTGCRYRNLQLHAGTCRYLHLRTPTSGIHPTTHARKNMATGRDRPNRSIARFRAPPRQIRSSRSEYPEGTVRVVHVRNTFTPACPYMSLRVRGTPSTAFFREACFRNRNGDHADLPLPSPPFPKRDLSFPILLTLFLDPESDMSSSPPLSFLHALHLGHDAVCS